MSKQFKLQKDSQKKSPFGPNIRMVLALWSIGQPCCRGQNQPAIIGKILWMDERGRTSEGYLGDEDVNKDYYAKIRLPQSSYTYTILIASRGSPELANNTFFIRGFSQTRDEKETLYYMSQNKQKRYSQKILLALQSWAKEAFWWKNPPIPQEQPPKPKLVKSKLFLEVPFGHIPFEKEVVIRAKSTEFDINTINIYYI